MEFRARTAFIGAGCVIALALAGCGEDNDTTAQAPVNDTTAIDSVPNGTTVNGTTANGTTQNVRIDDADDLVEDALEADAILKPFDLDAEDEKETIVLEGKVETQEQRAMAEEIAKHTVPQFPIVNRITVG